jgi:hypothetical protein
MRQRGCSMSRITAGIASLAVRMTTILAFRVSEGVHDTGAGVLGMFLALILTRDRCDCRCIACPHRAPTVSAGSKVAIATAR